ncbi:hypothetical protein OIU76_005089 [Salix suchowensis]|nr:hypothetical protein OIU76_005089 [Salix suchowensis]
MCDSSPRVFDSLFKTYAHMNKFRNATDVFSRMKGYGFLPTVESCNAYLSSLLAFHRVDIALTFYREMRRCRISPNSYTFNLTKKAAFLVKELDKEDLVPNASTFSALISGQCARKNSDRAFQLYKSMVRSGCHPNEQTFKMLISAFIENEDFEGAFSVLMDMFARSMASDSNTLLEICDGLCQCGKESLARKLCHEMKARRLIPEGFDRAEHFNSMTEKENRTFG